MADSFPPAPGGSAGSFKQGNEPRELFVRSQHSSEGVLNQLLICLVDAWCERRVVQALSVVLRDCSVGNLQTIPLESLARSLRQVEEEMMDVLSERERIWIDDARRITQFRLAERYGAEFETARFYRIARHDCVVLPDSLIIDGRRTLIPTRGTELDIFFRRLLTQTDTWFKTARDAETKREVIKLVVDVDERVNRRPKRRKRS